MYITGFLICWTFEGILLGCLAQWRLLEVAVIFILITIASLIFLTCIYWNKPLSKQITMAAIAVATVAALGGGLMGGSYLQSFWHYGDKNSWASVSSTALPSYWKGADKEPNVFHFVNNTYINVKLVGVVYRTPDLTYCAAPVLAKTDVPQEKVVYYATAVDCCSGTSKSNVHTHCYHWGDHDIVGERIPTKDMAFFELAVAKTAEWNKYTTLPDPVFLTIMSKDDHELRQANRKQNGLLIICFTPFVWPFLALIVYAVRWLTVASCGVHKKHSDSFQGV